MQVPEWDIDIEFNGQILRTRIASPSKEEAVVSVRCYLSIFAEKVEEWVDA